MMQMAYFIIYLIVCVVLHVSLHSFTTQNKIAYRMAHKLHIENDNNKKKKKKRLQYKICKVQSAELFPNVFQLTKNKFKKHIQIS